MVQHHIEPMVIRGESYHQGAKERRLRETDGTERLTGRQTLGFRLAFEFRQTAQINSFEADQQSGVNDLEHLFLIDSKACAPCLVPLKKSIDAGLKQIKVEAAPMLNSNGLVVGW